MDCAHIPFVLSLSKDCPELVEGFLARHQGFDRLSPNAERVQPAGEYGAASPT